MVRPDTKTLGKATDEVGITDEFQEMLVEAAKLGTLESCIWNGPNKLI